MVINKIKMLNLFSKSRLSLKHTHKHLDITTSMTKLQQKPDQANLLLYNNKQSKHTL